MVDKVCENESESDGFSSSSSYGKRMRSPRVNDESDRNAGEFLRG